LFQVKVKILKATQQGFGFKPQNKTFFGFDSLRAFAALREKQILISFVLFVPFVVNHSKKEGQSPCGDSPFVAGIRVKSNG